MDKGKRGLPSEIQFIKRFARGCRKPVEKSRRIKLIKNTNHEVF